VFQCGGGTIASAADSHTGANNADLIALEVIDLTSIAEIAMPVLTAALLQPPSSYGAS
jgi:L-asparaginase/Glu-tRNA(Gln) amidotransferase subunit D